MSEKEERKGRPNGLNTGAWQRPAAAPSPPSLLWVGYLRQCTSALWPTCGPTAASQPPHSAQPTPCAVELLKTASASLGIGPAYAMQVAERLYTQVGGRKWGSLAGHSMHMQGRETIKPLHGHLVSLALCLRRPRPLN